MSESIIKEVNEEKLGDTVEQKVEKEEKKIDVNELIEKGKKGSLSTSDLDDMLEELDYDMDRIDQLYETLEDNGIPLPGDM